MIVKKKLNAYQRKLRQEKLLTRIKKVIMHPQFLKYAEIFADKFIEHNGYGKYWLHEFQDMENKGQFRPTFLRAQYIKIVASDNNFEELGYIRSEAIHTICTEAEKAVIEYLRTVYKILVITGEQAYDEDDQPYDDLQYNEAKSICDALNEEAEEILFKVVKS